MSSWGFKIIKRKENYLSVVANGLFTSSTRNPPCEQLLAAVVGARFKGDGE
ncbi:hypothetical protein L208DRAFT_1385971 [Tricholoma matsutake]|nr:hypothetical protein L208DRAFT_1385971 [Tricholoma matsutake 945]